MAVHLAKKGIPALVLVLVLAGGAILWAVLDHAPDHEAAPPPPGPVAVSVSVVEPETLGANLRFLAQTEGSQVVEIRARVAGYLQERAFTEGQQVEKGSLLFQIDPKPFEVQLEQARARLASAQATLDRATQQVKRYEEAFARQAGTSNELDDWQTQRSVAQAQVQQATAEIAAANLELGYTTIESPITGVIGRSLKDVGSYVDAGQNGLLAVVQQVDPMYVRYSVTETELLRFQRQEDSGVLVVPELTAIEFTITLADGSAYPHTGNINFLDVQVDQTTGTSVVRGQVPNPDGLLRPGQFVYATITNVQRVNVIRVPQSAVQMSPSGASVLVIGPDGKAQPRPVELGEWDGNEYWAIEDGLEPGDKVITNRLMMVRPGTPVTIAEPQAEPAQPEGEPS
jgi:membrane fusion protein (multidrug efflux system)